VLNCIVVYFLLNKNIKNIKNIKIKKIFYSQFSLFYVVKLHCLIMNSFCYVVNFQECRIFLNRFCVIRRGMLGDTKAGEDKKCFPPYRKMSDYVPKFILKMFTQICLQLKI